MFKELQFFTVVEKPSGDMGSPYVFTDGKSKKTVGKRS